MVKKNFWSKIFFVKNNCGQKKFWVTKKSSSGLAWQLVELLMERFGDWFGPVWVLETPTDRQQAKLVLSQAGHGLAFGVWSEKMLVKQNFGQNVKKIFGKKKFLVKKKFWSKTFLVKKNFWSNKNFGQKKFLVQKKFWVIIRPSLAASKFAHGEVG